MVPAALADDAELGDAIEAWERAGLARFESVASLGALPERLEAAASAGVICDATSGGAAMFEFLRGQRSRGQRLPVVLLADESDRQASVRARSLRPCRVLDRETLSASSLHPALTWMLGSELPGIESPTQARRSARFAPAMLWKTGPDGGFTNLTRRWTAFTGREEHEELGYGWCDGIHPDDRVDWKDGYASALAARRGFTADLRLRHASGEYRWVRHQATPSFDAGEAFEGYIGSTFEIDDLERARDAAELELDRARLRADELEQFANAAAHDLQEPLRNLDYTLGQLEGGEAELVDRAQGLVDRMRDLVRDALAYSGVNRRVLAVENFESRSAVDWAVSNLRKVIEETDGEVEAAELPIVSADPIQLARVFQNLIENALRFRGDAMPRIEVGGEERGNEVAFWVRDNGVGIPDEDLESVFTIFTRLHGAEIQGTGAGLAICRRIVERHGGRIWAESQPGEGSTFWFTVSPTEVRY